MPGTASKVLESMLEQCELLDKAEKVGGAMYRFRWGSASVIAGAAGEAVVVIAPMFAALPEKHQLEFGQRLLEINGRMGGTAAFAIATDGSIILQTGRGVKGLDADEFRLMLGTVGKFADDYDDDLKAEFYGD